MKNLNVLKVNIPLFFLLIFSGCKTEAIKEPHDRYLFKDKVNSFFLNEIEITNFIDKPETQITEFKIKKNSHLKDDFLILLKNDGWIYKGSGYGVDTYCLGLNNRINFIAPSFNSVTDYKGNIYNIKDMDHDLIGYRYYKWGDDLCR